MLNITVLGKNPKKNMYLCLNAGHFFCFQSNLSDLCNIDKIVFEIFNNFHRDFIHKGTITLLTVMMT